MLRLENQEPVARLVMNHGKVNVMDIEFCRELVQHLEILENDSSQVLILSGNERVFSAGIDLKRWLSESDDYIEPFLVELERVMERLQDGHNRFLIRLREAAMSVWAQVTDRLHRMQTQMTSPKGQQQSL